MINRARSIVMTCKNMNKTSLYTEIKRVYSDKLREIYNLNIRDMSIISIREVIPKIMFGFNLRL